MSVINQMLRDLDVRGAPALEPHLRTGTAVVHATGTDAAGPRGPSAASAASTGMPLPALALSSDPVQRSRRQPALPPWSPETAAAGELRMAYQDVLARWLMLALLFGVAVFAWWWEQSSPLRGALPLEQQQGPTHRLHAGEPRAATDPHSSTAIASGKADAHAPAQTTSAPVLASSTYNAPESTAVQRTATSTASTKPSSARPEAPLVPSRTEFATAPGAQPGAVQASAAVPVARDVPPTTSAMADRAPSVGATVLAAAANAGSDALALVQRQHNAGREVLTQAQALAKSGAPEAALALLQDAWRTANQASPPWTAAARLPLLRELARLELAQGHAAAVLELLSSAEPVFASQPDVWALRANAAQRLARHPEAVQFYAAALQLRPAEPRWLLGSAVSLAALGQLGGAAQMVQHAKELGPVNKEVLGYLRQQGVMVAEP